MITSSVSILITGSELLDGRVLDTNTRFIAEELSSRQFTLKRVLVVDDDLSELEKGLTLLSEVSDFILISGGMGPTSDDLTREAAALFLEQPLVENSDARAHLEAFYAKRNRVLDSTNLKQALIPKTSTLIPNPIGTAPGFIGVKDGKHIAALPGVPRELMAMFSETFLPYLQQHLNSSRHLMTRGFKVFGVSESEVGRLVKSCNFPDLVKVSYRAAFPEVHVKLKGFIDDQELVAFTEQAIEKVGSEYIFTRDLDQSFSEVLKTSLLTSKATVAVAESCSGGMLGELLTAVPGSSAYFFGGIIAYHNTIKVSQLGVSEAALEQHGAVSSSVACEMAEGVRKRFRSTYGLSITGVAGPDGGSDEKPVGTFFVGISTDRGSEAQKFFFVSDRHRIRKFSAAMAADVLRRHLSSNNA